MQSNKYECSANATFQFISRNQKFKKAITASNPEKLKILINAIDAAHFNHSIFEDPKCDLYLNQLYANNQISDFVFANVYTYLMALMQFGSQPLKPEDTAAGKHPLIHKPVMIPLFKDNKINPGFKKQITAIVNYFKKPLFQNHAHINEHLILEFCKQLPKAESCMLRIRFADNDAETSTKTPMAVLNATSGILDSFYADGKVGDIHCDDFYLLNFRLIDFLNRLIDGNSMKLLPRFGLISDETLQDMHLNNVHIYPLYSTYVKGNVTRVHNNITGPFLIAMHDVFHAYRASLISESSRKFITANLIETISDNRLLSAPHIALSFDQIKPLIFGDRSFNDLLIQKAILKSGEVKYMKQFFMDTVLRYMENVRRENTINPSNIMNLVFALDRLYPGKFSKLLKYMDYACLSSDKRFDEFRDFYKDAYIQALERQNIPDDKQQPDGLEIAIEPVPESYNPTFFQAIGPVNQTLALKDDTTEPGPQKTS